MYKERGFTILEKLVLIFTCILSITYLLCSTQFVHAAETKNQGETKKAESKVTYNKETYTLKSNIETTLFMGIDNVNNEQEDGTVDSLGDSGMADCLFLVVSDKDTGKSQIIGINRDTMTDVDMLDIYGEYFRTANLQIALSHGYGDGKEQSCLNTVKAVSNLFGGIKIDHYVAMKMAAIPTINDAIGGVSVEVLEDLTSQDPVLAKGKTVELKGKQSLQYVKYRDTDKLDSNQLRIQRQKQYITAFTKKLASETSKDPFSILTLYKQIQKYVVTDLNTAQMQTLFDKFAKSGLGDENFHMVPGKLTEGKIYAEFHADEKGLKEMVLDLFYTKQK